MVAKSYILECDPKLAPTIVESIYEQTQVTKFVLPKFTLVPSSCFDLEISYRIIGADILITPLDDSLHLYPSGRDVTFKLMASVEGG